MRVELTIFSAKSHPDIDIERVNVPNIAAKIPVYANSQEVARADIHKDGDSIKAVFDLPYPLQPGSVSIGHDNPIEGSDGKRGFTLQSITILGT